MIRLKDKIIEFFLDNKRRIIITVVAIASSWMVIKGLMQIPAIEENRAELAQVEEAIENEKNRQSEIDDLATKVNSDEYIERIASEKLGLVKSNAIIFYDVSDED